jgi:hypothetical protein
VAEGGHDHRLNELLTLARENRVPYCKARGLSVEYLVVPGANHYTVPEGLADEKSPLAQATLKQMGLSADRRP